MLHRERKEGALWLKRERLSGEDVASVRRKE
jgi:hypothetical protein